MILFSRDELLGLAKGGSETVRVAPEGDDVLIVGHNGDELRMTTAQFDGLLIDIQDGTAVSAMELAS